MPSFSLVIEYITGYAVATDPSNRERAEWPPHPARVFMALAAAHFESDSTPEEKRAERAALDWLAELPPPDMTIPEHTPRDVVQEFVPVNDVKLPSLSTIQSWDMSKKADREACANCMLIPAYRSTNRKERFFPRVHIGSEPLRQTWNLPETPPDHHLDALESICRNVTRIGHSSSLVWVRLERNTAAEEPTHVPDEHSLEGVMRIVQADAMRRLEYAFNQSAIDEYMALEAEIDAAKGKVQKELKGTQASRFPRGRPTSQRPVFSISRGYKRVEAARPNTPYTLFDTNFIVLRESDDATQMFGLESTAAITQALRRLIMSGSKIQPVPSWVSGHEVDGSRLKSGSHMALIPLPFVGHEHADGHLMGLGIVLPRSVSHRDRASVFAPILFDSDTNQPKPLPLTMGRAGVWNVVRDTSAEPKLNLRTEIYTAPSRTWASVTPVLLDRMPKADRVKDPCAWREEVADIVAASCDRLFSHHDEKQRPAVRSVRTEKTPFFRGSLRAMPGQGGFPQLRRDKHQVHIVVEFDRPVQGPVLLCAGRFRGYGLMRPWADKEGA